MSKLSAGLAAKRLLTHRAAAAFLFGIWEREVEVAQVAGFVEAGGFRTRIQLPRPENNTVDVLVF